MAGLFGLFGGKNKNNDNSANNAGSFFLDPDEAKTLGNLEYMRSSDKIRRTFPKTRTNQVTEIVKEVSSMEVSTQSNQSKRVNPPSTPEQSQIETKSQAESKPTRRSSDSSLDFFRQMAKDIKK
jgi:cell division septation protein DedD